MKRKRSNKSIMKNKRLRVNRDNMKDSSDDNKKYTGRLEYDSILRIAEFMNECNRTYAFSEYVLSAYGKLPDVIARKLKENYFNTSVTDELSYIIKNKYFFLLKWLYENKYEEYKESTKKTTFGICKNILGCLFAFGIFAFMLYPDSDPCGRIMRYRNCY